MTNSAVDVDDRGAAALIELASRRQFHIAVAESLTGGLLAAEIVAVPGASAVFSGGIIAYDTALKQLLLGVDTALLARSGPVDEEVAKQMAIGVRQQCAIPIGHAGSMIGVGELRHADIGLATTGVAGPDPDPQTGLPAGTVWIAVSSQRGARALRVPGITGASRQTIREQTVQAAIALAISELDDIFQDE